MTSSLLRRRTLALAAAIVPVLALLIYVALRSGPLAPVAVTEARVESQPIHPAVFGIGTVEARYTYKIGPTSAGRLDWLDVHVGDYVEAGQVLGEMNPVDLDDRIRSQEAAVKHAEASIDESSARHAYAEREARRYEELFAVRSTSELEMAARRQDLRLAEAALAAVRQDLTRARSDLEALRAERANLRLIAPVDGVITLRDADPGTTVIAGQAVVEVINPESLWVNVRFDQVSAVGLSANLPAQIVLRSRDGRFLSGRVLRMEPKADAVTEEILAKVVFDEVPVPLPPVGELAEVTVDLAALPSSLVVPNAAVQRQGDRMGVWRIVDEAPGFTPIRPGRSDLEGRVQVTAGLDAGDRIVVYSDKALSARSRLHIVDEIR